MTETGNLLITDELRAWIDRAGPREPLEVLGTSDVRRYVDATGDDNPLWLDDDFARAMGYPKRLLPPLLVGWIPFSWKEGQGVKKTPPLDLRRQLPVPDHYTNVRNAGSETEWVKPVCLGEQLYSQSRIVDIVERKGRMGVGIYVTQEEQILNAEEEVVLRRRHTIALFPERETAEKGSSRRER